MTNPYVWSIPNIINLSTESGTADRPAEEPLERFCFQFELVVTQCAWLSPGIAQRVVSGIRLFRQGDVLASSYILMFNLESIVRRWVANQTGMKPQRFNNKPLGRLLPHIKPLVTTETYSYLYWLSIDKQGLNLRNRLAHGISYGLDNITYPVMLMHLYLLLFNEFSKQKRPAQRQT